MQYALNVFHMLTGGGPSKAAQYPEAESAVIAVISPSGYAGLLIPESGGVLLSR